MEKENSPVHSGISIEQDRITMWFGKSKLVLSAGCIIAEPAEQRGA